MPFVSKAIGMPLAKVAAKVMAGVSLAEQGYTEAPVPRQHSVKEAVFPFAKFAGIDIVLGPGNEIDRRGDGRQRDVSHRFCEEPDRGGNGAAHQRQGLHQRHQSLEGARGRSRPAAGSDWASICWPPRARRVRLEEAGIRVQTLMKIQEGHPNVIDYMIDGNLQLVINTPSGKGARTDEGRIRAAAVSHGISCITTLEGATAAVGAMEALRNERDDRPGRARPFPGRAARPGRLLKPRFSPNTLLTISPAW